MKSFLFVIFSATWLALYFVSAFRFTRTSQSSFELKRLEAKGDKAAAEQLAYEAVIPRLETIAHITATTLLVLGAALSVALFGWVVGVGVALVLAMLRTTVSRYDLVARLASRLLAKPETWLRARVKQWSWLDVLRPYTQSKDEPILESKEELSDIVVRSKGILSRDELLRFQASLTLDTRVVSDIMTPVSMVDCADVGDSLGPLVLDGLHKTGHSRFPVIDGDIHHVVGMLYLHNLVDIRRAKKTVVDAMDHRVFYIHENQTLQHALHGFLQTHHHLFIVVNDFQETVGVLSLEDVMEELLGKKIVDEFDTFDDLRAVAESNPRGNNQPKERTDI